MRRLILQTSLALGLSALSFASPAAAGTIRIMVPEYSARTKPFFAEAEQAFEASHPDTDIQIEMVPWGELRRRLATEMGQDNHPDLAIIDRRWLVDFVKLDSVKALDDLITDEFKGRFIDVFLAAMMMDGKTRGLPFTASVRALYYNKDMLGKAGIAEPPKTWDELKTAAEKIAKLGSVYGYGLPGKGVGADIYYYYVMWAQGVEIIDENGRSGLASDGAIAAVKFLKDLIDKGAAEPAVTSFPSESVEGLFKEGKLGMVIGGLRLAKEIREEGRGLNFGVAPIPAGPTGARGTYGETDALVLFKSAQNKNKEEAWKFVEFLYTTAQRARFTQDEGFLPVLKEETQAEYYANDAALKVFVELLPLARFAPLIAGWEIVAQRTTEGLQKIYLGSDANATLTAVAEEINRILLK